MAWDCVVDMKGMRWSQQSNERYCAGILHPRSPHIYHPVKQV